LSVRSTECKIIALTGIKESLTIGEHIDLPLGGHVLLEHFLLLFGEGVCQGVSRFYDLIQRLCILAVALKAALTGANVAEVKIFQNQRLGTSSAVDEIVKDNLFRPVPDAVHVPHPLHLIGGFELLGHPLLPRHLPGEQLHAFLASLVDLSQMLIQLVCQ
jgi:hypothetical protein